MPTIGYFCFHLKYTNLLIILKRVCGMMNKYKYNQQQQKTEIFVSQIQ